MSPDEDQLRAALRDGESAAQDTLRPDLIMSRARRERHDRQRNLRGVLGVAAAVIVIAGGGFGISQLGGHNSSKSSSSASRDSAAGAGSSQAAGAASGAGALTPPAPANPSTAAASSPAAVPPAGSSSAASSSAAAASAASACPSTTPVVPPLPGFTAPGLSAPLFAGNLTSLTVCVYQPDGSGLAGGKTYTGSGAQEIAATFNSAEVLPDPGGMGCTTDFGPTVLMLPSTAQGAGKAVIGNAGGCGATTNGSALRYKARGALVAVIQKVLPATAGSGRASPGPGPS